MYSSQPLYRSRPPFELTVTIGLPALATPPVMPAKGSLLSRGEVGVSASSVTLSPFKKPSDRRLLLTRRSVAADQDKHSDTRGPILSTAQTLVQAQYGQPRQLLAGSEVGGSALRDRTSTDTVGGKGCKPPRFGVKGTNTEVEGDSDVGTP